MFRRSRALPPSSFRRIHSSPELIRLVVKLEVGRWASNRAENSHLPLQRRERTTLRFRRMGCLQKFASVHANVHDGFSLERQLVDRQT